MYILRQGFDFREVNLRKLVVPFILFVVFVAAVIGYGMWESTVEEMQPLVQSYQDILRVNND